MGVGVRRWVTRGEWVVGKGVPAVASQCRGRRCAAVAAGAGFLAVGGTNGLRVLAVVPVPGVGQLPVPGGVFVARTGVVRVVAPVVGLAGVALLGFRSTAVVRWRCVDTVAILAGGIRFGPGGWPVLPGYPRWLRR